MGENGVKGRVADIGKQKSDTSIERPLIVFPYICILGFGEADIRVEPMQLAGLILEKTTAWMSDEELGQLVRGRKRPEHGPGRLG